MSLDYIDPKTATHVRVAWAGGYWLVDAADDKGGYTEACWDHYQVTEVPDHWEEIPTVEIAMSLVPEFVRENVPHLVKRHWWQRKTRIVVHP